jgi:signal transduction histidine kinase
MSQAILKNSEIVEISTNEIKLTKKPVNIRDLLIFFRSHHLCALDMQKVTMTLQIIPESIMAMIDQEKILQVFNQIFDNSMKALPDGGTIDIKAYRQSNNLIVSFIDNGLGMERQNLINIRLGLTYFINGNKMKLGV